MHVIEESRQTALDALADRLAAAWKEKGVIGSIAEQDIPRSRLESYYTQDRMAAALALPSKGWKIGATTVAVRKRDGHEDIIPGRLFEPSVFFGEQLTIDLGACPNPRVEPEFGFRLKADMPLRDTPWTAEEVAPLVSLYAALEIIGTRFEMPGASKSDLSLMSVADNGVCIAGVFNPVSHEAQGFDYARHDITLTVNDGAVADNLFGDMRSDPFETIAALANLLAHKKLSLHAGDLLLSGTLTVPQAVTKGGRIRANFGVLGAFDVAFT